jgi:hypothetical protein
MSEFGSGLGNFLGNQSGFDTLGNAGSNINGLLQQDLQIQEPYMNFGSSFLSPTQSVLLGSDSSGTGSNGTIGMSRLNGTGNDVTSYSDFMKNYQTSDAAKYTMSQADEAQNNSAAARGGLLSGANERELSTINQGISSQYANTAYNEYLAGNQQQFSQLETTLGNMFQGIGVGQTANGQYGQVMSADMQAQAAIAAAQAKSSSGKGSGMGSMFSGLMGMAAK